MQSVVCLCLLLIIKLYKRFAYCVIFFKSAAHLLFSVYEHSILQPAYTYDISF